MSFLMRKEHNHHGVEYIIAFTECNYLVRRYLAFLQHLYTVFYSHLQWTIFNTQYQPKWVMSAIVLSKIEIVFGRVDKPQTTSWSDLRNRLYMSDHLNRMRG